MLENSYTINVFVGKDNRPMWAHIWCDNVIVSRLKDIEKGDRKMTKQEEVFIKDFQELLKKHSCTVSIHQMYTDDEEALSMFIVGGVDDDPIGTYSIPINLQLKDLKEVFD